MSSKKKALLTTGKRKTSKARIVVTEGKGRVRVNNTPIHLYEPQMARDKIMESLILAGDVAETVDIKASVFGGGYMSQAEAVRMGVAHALVRWTRSKKLRTTYIDYDRTILAGDARRKESKKFGGPGARAKKQKSYR